MIEGQKDSEAEEIDKGGERTPWLKEEEMKKEMWWIQKWVVREKIEQESETDAE